MDKKSQVLAYENTVNTKYIRSIETKTQYRIAGGSKKQGEIAPLSGRVSVEGQDKGPCEDFYVGPRHMETDGLYVVSWAAPAAAVFFGGAKRWEGRKIRARRRFTKRRERLTDYADDWVVRPEGDPFEVVSQRGQKQAQRTAPAGGSSWLTKTRTDKPAVPQKSDVPVAPAPAPSVGSDLFSHLGHVAESATPTSSEELLRATLAAPRMGGLEAVLSTLQPEQYSLVTAEPTSSLIVQGHAGTGKTIIATHRAAWLIDSARGTPLRDVLLVGPTDAWEEHIASAVADLHPGEGNVTITSIQRTIMDLLELDGSRRDDARAMDPIAPPKGAELTIAELVGAYKLSSRRGGSLRGAYDAVLTLQADRASARAQDFYVWRSTLPRTYDTARSRPALWPLLAYIKVLIDPPRRHAHIVVDEAQDLSLLEWQTLTHLNAGAWTLVGDMNQRHSPRTFKKWKELYKGLPSTRWAEHVINNGFRTTQSISDFAASLLPITQRRRGASPLGEGKPPVVISVVERRRTMESLTIDECHRLSAAHAEGTVAVITPDLDGVAAAARVAGWKADGRHAYVTTEGQRFQLLVPEEARGLEFDAVVVMEPAAFRASSGTNGRLYTSLTRANLELVVVHDKPLPVALARAAKKLQAPK